ncbi:nickel pincer cofactor biosynthesis protein LarC [Blastococcus sp. TF02A_35]|uniref:nickel pincer cofactor biosynthesis protein LarC n=1 Tax=Blastococcus sp. TF02A-35 TaxID=2559612 RepID=UPI001074689C|nr:nickel pincer cofactor biosynthesis protein LarC [Blastococcus sp. TF02A_35]TFV53788.1 nickel pincer cofactor biosynthesis protein LarC [Blastococcus sp. TF02A_35]
MIGWLDLAAGASGDMLLGALVDAGVPLEVPTEAVAALHVEHLRPAAEQVSRQGLGATHVRVDAPEAGGPSTWDDVRTLLGDSALPPAVRDGSLAVLERLVAAQARARRVEPEDVLVHELGGLGALADVVGVVAALEYLELDRLTASPVALGSGSVRGPHGVVPVPAPAVLDLLAGLPVHAGARPTEMCTPTAAALLAARVDEWTPLPALRPTRVGTGAGAEDPDELPNVVRLVLGEPSRPAPLLPVVVEANVDDLDPRLWPGVLDAVLAAGASDAWLTPILVQHGRPAHMLSALCRPDVLNPVQSAVFSSTSTTGMRVVEVRKVALERTQAAVDVLGGQVGVKVAAAGERVVNVSVEFEDVVALAGERGLPVKEVLRAATAAAEAAYPADPASRLEDAPPLWE